MKQIVRFYQRYNFWIDLAIPMLVLWFSPQLGISQIWGWLLFVIFQRRVIAILCGSLFVRIRYRFKLPNEKNYTLKGDYILPFNGEWTVMAGGFDKKLAHHGSVIIPVQRYAYDFAIIYESEEEAISERAKGDESEFPTDLTEYHAFGKEVIAIADGEVVTVVKHHPESRVGGMKTYNDTTDERGNFIVIKHHYGEYSLTAHLMAGSIVVKKGDKVKQGQVIAKCGNSGNTTAPHIHFQLQTNKYFDFSASLPIAFTDIGAKQSDYYHDVFPNRTTENNLSTVGNKTYIGRGLDVENR